VEVVTVKDELSTEELLKMIMGHSDEIMAMLNEAGLFDEEGLRDETLLLSQLQNAAASGANATESASMKYKAKANPNDQFCYVFTNCRFMAWLGMLSPCNYTMVLNIIACIMFNSMNLNEYNVMTNFLANLKDIMSAILSRQVFLNGLKSSATNAEAYKAIETDFNTLNEEYNQLLKRVAALEATKK
jgi:hypothetical protein